LRDEPTWERSRNKKVKNLKKGGFLLKEDKKPWRGVSKETEKTSQKRE